MYGTFLLAFLLVVAFFINPFLMIGVVMLGAVLFGVLGGGKVLRDARVGTGPGPSGVPTTRDASYDPVSDPRSHPST